MSKKFDSLVRILRNSLNESGKTLVIKQFGEGDKPEDYDFTIRRTEPGPKKDGSNDK